MIFSVTTATFSPLHHTAQTSPTYNQWMVVTRPWLLVPESGATGQPSWVESRSGPRWLRKWRAIIFISIQQLRGNVFRRRSGTSLAWI